VGALVGAVVYSGEPRCALRDCGEPSKDCGKKRGHQGATSDPGEPWRPRGIVMSRKGPMRGYGGFEEPSGDIRSRVGPWDHERMHGATVGS
jgi:hypothetical protein